jgi:hypothetical protein
MTRMTGTAGEEQEAANHSSSTSSSSCVLSVLSLCSRSPLGRPYGARSKTFECTLCTVGYGFSARVCHFAFLNELTGEARAACNP